MSESDHSSQRTDEDEADSSVRVPSAGDRVGKYFVLEPLGEGAMGVVVRAYDPDLERSVAIKVVQPRLGQPSRTEASRARLLNEARALARISHPNVVAVYEVGIHNGLIFVAMELVDGVDLQHWLKERSRSWREVVDAFEAAGRGLHQVHLAGLVHRDVKPANILVGNDGRVRVGDLGIARVSFELPGPSINGLEPVDGFDFDTTALTGDGRVVGTLAYMAPEQHAGADVGPEADQFAFCVALYEALWRRRPFATDMKRLLAAKLAGPHPPGSSRRVPRWLFPIVARGLHRDPTRRFASMEELCDALRTDPAARRRRFAGAAAAAIAVTGAFTIAVLRPGPCDDSSDPLAGVWDPPTRAAVERVFVESDRPWAPQAWAHAGPTLDAYADEWTAMRRDSCEATHVRREQTAEQLDRRTVCLEARRRGLAATTEVLLEGNPDAIDHAFELVGRLRSVTPCGDLVALASAMELPDDEALRTDVDEVRVDIARARAWIDAGRYRDASELAIASTVRARELDYAPLVAETLALEGEARLRIGQLAESRAALEEAVWTAMGAGHDEIAAAASSTLVFLSGTLEPSLVEALRWGELAGASIRRRHSDDVHELVQLENALGSALVEAAQFDEALQTFERALVRIADDPDAFLRGSTIRHNIAILWLARGELERGREVLEPLIADLEPMLGRDHPRVVKMRGTLAQVLGTAGDHERAVALFRAEVEGLRIASGEDSLEVAHARTNLAVELGQLGKTDEAIAVTEQALAAFEREGDLTGVATCLGNVADDYMTLGAYDAAGLRFERALSLFEKLHPDGRHPDMSASLVGIGRVRIAQGRFEDALSAFERADRIVRESAGPMNQMRGLALVGKTRALRHLDRLPEALAVADENLEIVRASSEVSPEDTLLAHTYHAGVLADLARFDDALAELDDALQARHEDGLDHAIGATEAERARVLDELGRRSDARIAATRALAAIERAVPRDAQLLAHARTALAKLTK